MVKRKYERTKEGLELFTRIERVALRIPQHRVDALGEERVLVLTLHDRLKDVAVAARQQSLPKRKRRR